MNKNNIISTSFINDIRELINHSKNKLARVINSEITILYWTIGKRVEEELLKNERAEYGEEVVKTLAVALSVEYGKGFTYSAITRMVKFYECFSSFEIVATVSQQLSWSHIIEIIPIKDMKKREFYTYMAVRENWSVRELRSSIQKMTYERTIASQKSEKSQSDMVNVLENNNQLHLDIVLKDPLVLDFLNLTRGHTETELEDAILSELQKFIL